MITAYDATFARLASEAGAETILVGDSLGMVLQGHETTIPSRSMPWLITLSVSRVRVLNPLSLPTFRS
jgi:ketopantoate hydroxymethyltransferase